jgi:hypothetical protein
MLWRISQLLDVSNRCHSRVGQSWIFGRTILLYSGHKSQYLVLKCEKTKLCSFEEFVSYCNQQKFSKVTQSVILDLDSRVKKCA